MKKIVIAACMVASCFLRHPAHAEGQKQGQNNGLTQQQKQQLLGEVIGVGIAGAVVGAAIQANQNNRRPNGWNNNNNGWNNNNNGWNNNNNGWNNNNNGWNNNNNGRNNNIGRRYDSNPPSNSTYRQAPVYHETYPSQPQRVYSTQPVYSSTIEGERIISSSPVITSEPVISSSQVISSNPVITSERVISSTPSISSERVVPSPTVKENSLPYKGPGVKILLAEAVGGEVTYVIDGVEEATIQAGQEQTLTKKGKYEIRFSRGRSEDGKDFGLARYTVTEGTYAFEVTEKGWDLLREKALPPTTTNVGSPSGIKTNAIPTKPSPAAPNAVPSAPATATAPGDAAAEKTTPALPPATNAG
jgi:hypothetical protein